MKSTRSSCWPSSPTCFEGCSDVLMLAACCPNLERHLCAMPHAHAWAHSNNRAERGFFAQMPGPLCRLLHASNWGSARLQLVCGLLRPACQLPLVWGSCMPLSQPCYRGQVDCRCVLATCIATHAADRDERLSSHNAEVRVRKHVLPEAVAPSLLQYSLSCTPAASGQTLGVCHHADLAARAAAGLLALHAACTKALGFALDHLVDLRHAGLLLYLSMLASCTLGGVQSHCLVCDADTCVRHPVFGMVEGRSCSTNCIHCYSSDAVLPACSADAAHVKLGCGLLSQLARVQQRATSWVNSSAEDAELPPDGTAASLPVIVELLPICDQVCSVLPLLRSCSGTLAELRCRLQEACWCRWLQ